MCVEHSEMGDGNHIARDIPILLAGRAGGGIAPGRHIARDDEPLANLWIALLQALGGDTQTFGDDGDAPLSGLT